MASITRRATATTLTDTPTMDEAKQPLSPTTPIGPASPAVFPPLAPPAVAAFIHPLDPSHHPLPTFRTYKRRFPGYILLLLLSLMVSYSFTAFAVVAPVVADYFSTSTTTVNWFATLWLFCNTLACPLACWAMRRGSKTALVIGAALMLVSSWLKFGGTRIRSLGLAMAGQMLSGFASAFVCNVPVLYSNEWFSPGTRAVATAVGCLANVAGGVLGSLVMPVWVEGVGDVEGSVLWTGVITTVVAVPVVFIPKLPPTAPSVAVGEVEKVSVREEIRWLVRSREAVVLTVAFMTASGLWNSMSALLLEVLLPCKSRNLFVWGFPFGDLCHLLFSKRCLYSPTIRHRQRPPQLHRAHCLSLPCRAGRPHESTSGHRALLRRPVGDRGRCIHLGAGVTESGILVCGDELAQYCNLGRVAGGVGADDGDCVSQGL